MIFWIDGSGGVHCGQMYLGWLGNMCVFPLHLALVVERFFTSSGVMNGDLRKNTKEETLEYLMCVNKNAESV